MNSISDFIGTAPSEAMIVFFYLMAKISMASAKKKNNSVYVFTKHPVV